MKNLYTLLIIIFAFILMSSCSDDQVNNTVEPLEVPEQINDGWETATPEDVGLRSIPLAMMMDEIESQTHHSIHDILIIKNNKLVFEKYFFNRAHRSDPPRQTSTYIQYKRDDLHYLASVSKSVTSVAFGNAVLNGFINSDMQKKVSEYLPQYSSILTGTKENLTVEHLLTMTTGLNFDETTYPYGDYRNDITRLFTRPDPIEFVLSKDMHAEPGEQFFYNSGATNVLAEIIRQTSGSNLLDYTVENVFTPLGITQYRWERLSSEYYFASGGLWLTPRDLAKIGSLFLNGGQWNGTQIISQEWVDASKAFHVNPHWGMANGYGYQWWSNWNTGIRNFQNYFFAAGYGEQMMYINPELDMIVVFNCGYFGTPELISPEGLLREYIVLSTLTE